MLSHYLTLPHYLNNTFHCVKTMQEVLTTSLYNFNEHDESKAIIFKNLCSFKNILLKNMSVNTQEKNKIVSN